MNKLCLVCTATTDGRLRNGVVACQACKSFFLRYFPNRDGLKCEMGRNDCPVATNPQYVADRRRFRFICPKCRFQRCQEVGMKPPKTGTRQKMLECQSGRVSLLPQITVEAKTKETLNTLMKMFMDISRTTASTSPGLVQEWNSQESYGQVVQSFLNNSDHVSRLFIGFLKVSPFYKKLTMADRCSTFFQCGTRLNRIFHTAPAAINRTNFHRLQTLCPDFKVYFDHLN